AQELQSTGAQGDRGSQGGSLLGAAAAEAGVWFVAEQERDRPHSQGRGADAEAAQETREAGGPAGGEGEVPGADAPADGCEVPDGPAGILAPDGSARAAPLRVYDPGHQEW